MIEQSEKTNLEKSGGSKSNLNVSKGNLATSKFMSESKSSFKGSKGNILSKYALGSTKNLQGNRSGYNSIYGSKAGLSNNNTQDVQNQPNARAVVFENTYRLKPEKK